MAIFLNKFHSECAIDLVAMRTCVGNEHAVGMAEGAFSSMGFPRIFVEFKSMQQRRLRFRIHIVVIKHRDQNFSPNSAPGLACRAEEQDLSGEATGIFALLVLSLGRFPERDNSSDIFLVPGPSDEQPWVSNNPSGTAEQGAS